jgi:hypothetical protein
MGSYVSTQPSASNDRQCKACGTASYTASHNQNSCQEWTDCPSGQYVTTPGTTTSDQECSFGDACEAGTKVAVSASTSTGNTQCSKPDSKHVTYHFWLMSGILAACDPGKYRAEPHRETTCLAPKSCHASQYIETDMTATSDRVCSTCGKFGRIEQDLVLM